MRCTSQGLVIADKSHPVIIMDLSRDLWSASSQLVVGSSASFENLPLFLWMGKEDLGRFRKIYEDLGSLIGDNGYSWSVLWFIIIIYGDIRQQQ